MPRSSAAKHDPPADPARPEGPAGSGVDLPSTRDLERYSAPWQPSRRSAVLRFEPQMEALFEAGTRDFRVRELRLTITLSALFYVLTSVIDPVMVPDMGSLGLWMRCSTIPIWLFFIVLARRFPAALRESYIAVLGTYAVVMTSLIATLSTSASAPYEFTIGMLTIIYINTTYPLRFGFAFAASAASLAATLTLLFLDAKVAPGLAASIGLLFSVAATYSLIACYRIERAHRLAFLLSHRESQRLAAIAADRDAASIRSDTDALTGLPNRRHFDRRLAALLHAPDRGGDRGLGLLMLDVDHFKSYNDHYGHPAGDAALRGVARIIEHVVREGGDFAARYGGEEFVLLLEATDPDRMRTVAQRICHAVHDGAIEHSSRADGMAVVTVSIGASIMATGVGPARLADAATQLVEAADHALYAAKKAGRNRVELAAGAALQP